MILRLIGKISILLCLVFLFSTQIISSRVFAADATGEIIKAESNTEGLLNIEVSVSDDDGLKKVSLVFVKDGDPLVVYEAQQDENITEKTWTGENINPEDYGITSENLCESVIGLWVKDKNDDVRLVAYKDIQWKKGNKYKLKRTCFGSMVGKMVYWFIEPSIKEEEDKTNLKLKLKNLKDGNIKCILWNDLNPQLVKSNNSAINATKISYTFSEPGIYEISLVGDKYYSDKIFQIIAPKHSSDDTTLNNLKKFDDIKNPQFDVIVVGGTSAGIGAAYTAANEGLKTCLVEPTDLLGGMFTNGIGKSDIGLNGFGDLSTELSYGMMEKLSKKIEAIPGSCNNGLKFAPAIARKAIYELLQKDNLTIITRAVFISAKNNENEEYKYEIEIRNYNPEDDNFLYTITIKAKYIIDATDCGDVAVALGADYEVSEPTQAYSFVMTLKKYNDKNNNWAYIEHKPSYCGCEGVYTQEPIESSWTYGGNTGNLCYSGYYQLKHHKPSDTFEKGGKIYRRLGYELIDSKELRPDLPDNMVGYAKKNNDEKRDDIKERYLNHSLCFLYHMQHLEDGEKWGLTEDQDPERGNFPARMYVREGKRIKGKKRFIGFDALKNWNSKQCEENKCDDFKKEEREKFEKFGRGEFEQEFKNFGKKEFNVSCSWEDFRDKYIAKGEFDRPYQPIDRMEQSIGVVTYSMDIHNKHQQKDLSKNSFLVDYTGPGLIPFDIMVPVDNNQAIKNVLVPLAVSSSERGYSTLRMDPTRINLGMAAALAIKIAEDKKINTDELTENKKALFELQDKLISDYDAKIFLYKDIDKLEQEQKKAIQFASIWGIIKGYSDNTNGYKFLPNKNVRREEFLKMVLMAYNKIDKDKFKDCILKDCILEDNDSCDISDDYGDHDKIPSWARCYVKCAKAKDQKIMIGYSDGNFYNNESGEINKAEMIKVVMKTFFSEVFSKDYNEPEIWFKEYSIKASQMGIISKEFNENDKDTKFTDWGGKKITRGEAALVIFNAIRSKCDPNFKTQEEKR